MDNRHIDPAQLSMEDLMHIATCDFCADTLADYVETHELLMAPKNMQESILMQSRQINVQVIAKSNQISKQLQLFYYTLKVGFATVMVLSFMLWTPKPVDLSPVPPVGQESSFHPFRRIYEHTQDLTQKLQNVSQYLSQMEVLSHDK